MLPIFADKIRVKVSDVTRTGVPPGPSGRGGRSGRGHDLARANVNPREITSAQAPAPPEIR